ncbi:helix-turn-helix transcriptional regulator [Sulfurospirillum oryzae]|uniref:helix-turn-helix transcriptional regulator n=1 Tax=Sulfurospirillum oryzae TaxID=2976535 RepID=UPI0021E73F64|nr:WYL domain-containing protein [Sulfurospirillum oryzae]
MNGKKIFEVFELLQELTRGKEIVISDYAAKKEISERTLRRYFEDLRSFFGEHSIIQTARGSYTSINKEFFNHALLPSVEDKIEIEHLIDLLHIINPGFTNELPSMHRKVDNKIQKELTQVFLIKGSPSETLPSQETFDTLKKAIKGRRYCDIVYEKELLSDVKPLKIIYCKGNWSLAILHEHEPSNNGFRFIRVGFIDSITLQAKTFNKDTYSENFVCNAQSFFEGYKIPSYEAIVAIPPYLEKFFRQKSFSRTQKILGTLPNGWIKISYQITSNDFILMLARRWFPDMIILEPKEAREEINAMIEKYQDNKAQFFNEPLDD